MLLHEQTHSKTSHYMLIMAKTHGFHKVAKASAVTRCKRQISKVVTIPVADSGIIRPIIVFLF
jgi:hypothetical protein